MIFAHCQQPPVIANANHNFTNTGHKHYTIGTVVQYRCSVGFTTAGKSRFFKCNGSEWVDGEVYCSPIKCMLILSPRNGIMLFHGDNTMGSTAEFSCESGYNLVGFNKITCLHTGHWSETVPKCQARRCNEFPKIKHAQTVQEVNFNGRNYFRSIVNVTCKDGFFLNGPSRVMCQANGQWGPRPTCHKPSCKQYPRSNCIASERIHKNQLEITCMNNVSVTRTGPTGTICTDSNWSTLDIACFCDCQIAYDNLMTTITNFKTRNYLGHGHTLQWDCIIGKKVPVKITCDDGQLIGIGISNVTLDGELELCKIENNKCGRPPEISNAVYNTTKKEKKYLYGTVLEVKCNQGFYLNQSPFVTCQANGEWGPSPHCIKASCGQYPKSNCIANRHMLGNTFEIFCRRDVSVTKIGPDSVTCVNGNWSSTEMACFCDCKLKFNRTTTSIKNLQGNYLGHGVSLNWDCLSGIKHPSNSIVICNDGDLVGSDITKFLLDGQLELCRDHTAVETTTTVSTDFQEAGGNLDLISTTELSNSQIVDQESFEVVTLKSSADQQTTRTILGTVTTQKSNLEMTPRTPFIKRKKLHKPRQNENNFDWRNMMLLFGPGAGFILFVVVGFGIVKKYKCFSTHFVVTLNESV